jgi:hypothetical protein
LAGRKIEQTEDQRQGKEKAGFRVLQSHIAAAYGDKFFSSSILTARLDVNKKFVCLLP